MTSKAEGFAGSQPKSESASNDLTRSTPIQRSPSPKPSDLLNEDDEEDHYGSEDDAVIEEDFNERVHAIIEGFDTPYNPTNEALLALPTYHPSFAKVRGVCDGIVALAAELLQDPEFNDEQIREQLKSAQSFKYPPPRRIGIVGEPGAGNLEQLKYLSAANSRKGKSSLINSILDTPELALEVPIILSSNA